MAGFILNSLSEESLGSPVNAQSNTGDVKGGGQFKQVLNKASLESVELSKPLAKSDAGANSGKDVPVDRSLSTQVLADSSLIKSNNQVSQWSNFSDQTETLLETGGLSDVLEVNASADLNVESGSLEASLTSDKLIVIDIYPGINNSKIAQNTSDINSVDNLSSINNELINNNEITKGIESQQKGILEGVSISGQGIYSKPQDQLIQSSQAIEQATKSVEKLPVDKFVELTLNERQTKLISEGGLLDKKLQELKLSEPMKNGTFVEEEDFSKMLKPESSKLEGSKFDRLLSKSEQLDSLPKTDIGQIAAQLKSSNLYDKTISASNSHINAFSASELDPMPAINKLTIAANTEFATGAAKDAQNIIANSTIQSGLSLKRNFSPNLAARIQWIYNQAISSAEILMDPPDLGPLSVKLTKVNGETNVLFQVTNPSTKEAIEDNLAKLKEMLSEQGINLGDTQVEQQQKNDKDENLKEQIAADSSLDSDEPIEQRDIHVQQGILDTYI